MREFLSRVKDSDPCRVSGSVQHGHEPDGLACQAACERRHASRHAACRLRPALAITSEVVDHANPKTRDSRAPLLEGPP
jgi:hypothetical protein